jgi:hypothetical protein
MPQRIGEVSKDFLVNVTLPQHGATYTVISHKFVIDTVIAELNAKGFYINEEYYRATGKGDIAVGVYKLNHTTDPELSMMFAWTNSYNKQVKFKAVVGASVNANESFMILGEQGSWTRKHTGTADIEAKQHIIDQISLAGMYYDQLVADKNLMKDVTLTTRDQAKWLGIFFAEYGILSAEQANYVKGQMSKPSYFYNGGNSTLWAFYNHVTMSMQQAHPKSWLEDQRMLHYLITSEFNLIKPIAINVVAAVVQEPLEVDNSDVLQIPGQTNLLDAIADIEGDNSEEDSVITDEEVNNLNAEYDPIFDAIPAPTSPIENKAENSFVEENEEMIKYQDNACNTFEAPVVTPCAAHDVETEKEEATVDLSNLEGEYTVDEVDDVINNIEEKIEEAKEASEYKTKVEMESEVTPEEKHDVTASMEFEAEEDIVFMDDDDDDFDFDL